MVEESGIVQFLKKEHERLTKEIRGVSAALTAFGAAYTGKKAATRGAVSEAIKAKIAAAQKARWAKVKSGGDQHAALQVGGSPKKKSTVSAASRKKMAAAQKARWAKIRMAKKPS